MPFARLLNLFLKQEVVHFDWKEANIVPLYKKVSKNKSNNYRSESLITVICKLLERLVFYIEIQGPVDTIKI